jgi:hypothetical protein
MKAHYGYGFGFNRITLYIFKSQTVLRVPNQKTWLGLNSTPLPVSLEYLSGVKS